jgi:phosphatidylinositol-3-phosphatase
MKTQAFRFIFLILFSQSGVVLSQAELPVPEHIVIAILESHGYPQLIGSSAAPYINSLATDTSSALFAESYGITHPSQPNYLVLFSGSTQGVTSNNVPSNNPFTTPNLAHQLIDSGKTFISYSEDLPEAGYNGATSGYYARKHNPVTNWMGTGINQVPATLNQPFTAFPTDDFSSLPTVCYVIPNLQNDMHNGSDPGRITRGDDWLSTNLDSYIQWAKANNSLFILTFDEEGTTLANHILTIITGPMVKSGQYSTKINHYSVLHTIEKMYGLVYVGDSLNYTPITYCWKESVLTNISTGSIPNGILFPNPTDGSLYIKLSDYSGARVEIFNVNGQLVQDGTLISDKTAIDTDGLVKGFYIVKINSREGIILNKMIKN